MKYLGLYRKCYWSSRLQMSKIELVEILTLVLESPRTEIYRSQKTCVRKSRLAEKEKKKGKSSSREKWQFKVATWLKGTRMDRRSLFTIGDYGSRSRRWRRRRRTPIKRCASPRPHKVSTGFSRILSGIPGAACRQEGNVFIKGVFKSRRKERKG